MKEEYLGLFIRMWMSSNRKCFTLNMFLSPLKIQHAEIGSFESLLCICHSVWPQYSSSWYVVIAPVAKQTVGAESKMTAPLLRLMFRYIFLPESLYKWICMVCIRLCMTFCLVLLVLFLFCLTVFLKLPLSGWYLSLQCFYKVIHHILFFILCLPFNLLTVQLTLPNQHFAVFTSV